VTKENNYKTDTWLEQGEVVEDSVEVSGKKSGDKMTKFFFLVCQIS
jgi:hypothetical protein